MKSTKIPVYFYPYNSDQQVGVGFMILTMDNAFYDRYKNYTSWHTLNDTSGVRCTSLAAPVNGVLGFPFININTMCYMVDTANDLPAKASETFALLSCRPVLVYNNTQSAHLWYRTIGNFSCSSAMAELMWSGSTLVRAEGSDSLFGAHAYLNTKEFTISGIVYKEDAFDENGLWVNADAIEIRVTGHFSSDLTYITSYAVEVKKVNDRCGWPASFNVKTAQGSDVDLDNPFPGDDDDGGDGPNNPPVVDPTDVPELPDTDIGNCGLFTMYTPTLAQIQALGAFLWTGLFDPDNFKKLFTNPMDCIIGLGILPCAPSSAGSKNIKFGSVDSGISSSYITTQYKQFECGSVKIDKQVGSFLDYLETKISIFLPFIGFRELATADVMGGTISVTYNVDCLTGSCVAFVKHSARGVMYAFNGSCIANVPLSGTNFSGAIQNAVSTVASGVGVLAGMASGAAPLTAMSAASMLTSAANTALNAKPNVQRSGNIGGAAGLLSGKKPFVIIERPNYSVPDFIENYEGRVCNKSAILGNLSGFTMVEKIHLDNIDATAEELNEIDKLLKEGVIL